jgi:hypothetical protein
MARKTKGKSRRRPRKTQKGRRGRKQTRKYKGGTSSMMHSLQSALIESLHLSDLQGSLRLSDLQPSSSQMPGEQNQSNSHFVTPQKESQSTTPTAPIKSENRMIHPETFNIRSTTDLEQMGNASDSINGMVMKLKTDHNKKYILKIPQNDPFSDNLLYEYHVGLYINKLRQKYPCFINTYALFYLNPETENTGTSVKNDISRFFKSKPFISNEDVKQGKLKNIVSNIGVIEKLPSYADSCLEKLNFAILLEHIEGKTLKSIISKIADTEIPKIYYQIYGPLAKLDGYFTHNDLHTDNIMITKMASPIHFTYNLGEKDGEKVSFTTKYLARMIDYGRARIDPEHSLINLKDFYVNVNDKANAADMQSALNLCGLMHLHFRIPDPDRLGTSDFSVILKDLKAKIIDSETKKRKKNTTTTPIQNGPYMKVNVQNTHFNTNIPFLNPSTHLKHVSIRLFANKKKEKY